jgi:hypothetical protein
MDAAQSERLTSALEAMEEAEADEQVELRQRRALLRGPSGAFGWYARAKREENIGEEIETAHEETGLDRAEVMNLALQPAPQPEQGMLMPGEAPSLLERAKQFVRERTGLFEPPIYGEQFREQQPLRTLGRIAAHYGTEYLSGLGLNIPDVIAHKVSGEESLAEAVDKLTGFKPTPKEIQAGEAMEYVGGLKTVGRIAGKLVSKIAARQALKTMLASGLQFGGRAVAEQTAENIISDKPFDLEGIHFEAGVGVLFGAGEEGIRALAKFIRGVRSPKALALYEPPKGTRMTPKQHAAWARQQAVKEIRAAQKAGGKEWERVRAKYMGLGGEAPQAKPAAKPTAPKTAGTALRTTDQIKDLFKGETVRIEDLRAVVESAAAGEEAKAQLEKAFGPPPRRRPSRQKELFQMW